MPPSRTIPQEHLKRLVFYEFIAGQTTYMRISLNFHNNKTLANLSLAGCAEPLACILAIVNRQEC